MKHIKNREEFLNESFDVSIASNDSPIGFYTIANALSPEKFFKELDKLDIKYKHDGYSNFIQVFVPDIKTGSIVRKLVLSDILEADDIDDDDLPYMKTPDDIGDHLEIKLI